MLFTLLCSFMTSPVLGQLEITVKTMPAECSNNGIIEVTATGGSGNYTYILESDCEDNIPPQTTAIFTALEPCNYIVRVQDNNTNATETTTTELSSIYEPLDFTIKFEENCGVTAAVTGGKPPYTFQYSLSFYDEQYVDNIPPSSPDFSNIEQDYIAILVRDACGNTLERYRAIKKNPIEDHELKYEADGIKITPEGGEAPYTFELVNENNSTTNDSGTFEWANLGCESKIRIKDQCNSVYEEDLEISLSGRVICSNISMGEFTMVATRGVPPFKFEIEIFGETFFSDTGLFTNLPINRSYYKFFIHDACGNKEEISSLSRYKPSFSSYPIENCQDKSLSFKVDRQCTGVERYPMIINCLSCTPQQEVIIESGSQLLELEGSLSGEWEISLQDDCGEATICKDKLKLELTPACDSITARIVDFFTCDNGTTSRRLVQDEQAIFTLFDDQGMVLERDNTNGVFKNLTIGKYKVVVATPACDTLESTVSINEAQDLSVVLETSIYTVENDTGSCDFRYTVRIEQQQGPFILTGGPTDGFYRLLNDYGEDNCLYYVVSNLQPGTYIWKSLNSCGVDTMILPTPNFDLEVSINRVCASGSTIEVTGGRTLEDWLDWFEPYDLNIDLEEETNDYYSIKSNEKKASSSGTNFYGLSPREHTIYLHPFNKFSCAASSIKINIPTYRPAKIVIDGTTLCDGAQTTELAITMQGGQAPYRLEQLDCENGSRKELVRTEDGNFKLAGISKGIHCFVAKDGCSISNDLQVNVRSYTDSIDYKYDCNGQLTLTVDSIRAIYNWKDESGTIAGKKHQLILPNPTKSLHRDLTIQFGKCQLERQIDLLPRTIFPTLTLNLERALPILCGTNDAIQLSAQTDAETLDWNTGDTTTTIQVTSPGFYLGRAINDLGCEKSATIQILQKTEPQPKIVQTAFCANDEIVQLYLNKKYSTIHWSTQAQTDTIEVINENTYWVEVEDENNCIGADTLQLKRTLLTPILFIQNPLCVDNQDGFIAIDQVNGGTAPYQLITQQEQVSIPWEINDLTGGEYSLIIIDSFHCTWDTTLQLIQPEPLTLMIGKDQTLEFGDSLQLVVTSNFEDWQQWEWTANGQLLTDAIQMPTVCPTKSTIYKLSATNSNGCQIEDELLISVNRTIPIYAPNLFSPNGDGNNDFFMPYVKANTVKNISLSVFDRFGNQVFTATNLTPNDSQLGWNGQYNGKFAMPGVYLWSAEIVWKDNQKEVISGDLTLLDIN